MTSRLDIRDLQLNALLEITQAINNNLAEQNLFKIYRFTVLADLKVKQLALYVKDEEWSCKVHFGTSVNWEEVVLEERFQGLIKTKNLGDDEGDFSIFDQAIPVSHKNRLLAVVFIGGVPSATAESSNTFLETLTNILIVAIENKKFARRQLEQEVYRKELEIAKKVQNFLFPKTLPKSQRLSIEAVYLPHFDVGGDYYDYLVIDEDRFVVCVADVSGKGVPAALLMSNFQASLRTLIRKTQDPKEIVNELNYVISQSGNGENFITFFLGLYDFKEKSFEYVNCGHNPLYLVTDTEVLELNNGTTVLGMFNPLPFLETVKMENLHEFLFFGYTDGLTETFNSLDEQYGESRLLRFFTNGIPHDIDQLHMDILKSIDDFREDIPYHDDITILSCLVKN